MSSSFFARLDRLRWIKRWGLKRNHIEENVMEHSWQVATIAHMLAIIHNKKFNGQVNSEKIATLALYHDVSEVITGDLPTPVKYHSPTITQAYKAIEREAELDILKQLPKEFLEEFTPLIDSHSQDKELYKFVKWADIICAWLKCRAEINAGNNEFIEADKEIEQQLRHINSPEVNYFLATFTQSYQLTLDELLTDFSPQK